MEARLYQVPSRHGSLGFLPPEQGLLLRPSPSCPGGGQAQPGQEQPKAGTASEAQGARKSLGVLCSVRPRSGCSRGEGPKGAALRAPECGARRRGAAQTLLPSPVAHLCPPRPVLPAELTPPLLLLSALASAPIPSASSLCGQGRGWLSGVVVGELGGQPSCISRTSLPYPHPDSHLGLRSSKGPHTSRPQTRTGVPWASAFGLTQPRGARKSLGVHCDSGQG